MTIRLDQLVAAINPSETVLLLGAGASVPSGAPTGSQLAAILWKDLNKSDTQSENFTDTATMLTRKHSRQAVVDVIIKTLSPIQPTGALLALPKFEWKAIYTTNFDSTIERAYARNKIALSVLKSNFDFTNKESAGDTKLYKIHGCLTEDETLGHKSSMTITEHDYENHQRYRQALFSQLQTSLITGNALIVGHSLGDSHLYDLVREVLRSKQDGAPGHVYVLVYNKDDLKAPLLEDRGAKICFASIDEFIHSLSQGISEQPNDVTLEHKGLLPAALLSSTLDVNAELRSTPNIPRMFSGGPATYADIHQDATFQRAPHDEVLERLSKSENLFIAVIGAAGVGKTTFARQILRDMQSKGSYCWEHRHEFSFDFSRWLSVESQLRNHGRKGILFIDECTHNMRSINRLIDELSRLKEPALHLVLTANAAQWAPRLKSPNFFRRGAVIELSTLKDREIYSLLNLVEYNASIANLVQPSFKRQNRDRQYSALRLKCSADMFVCLKNIFANENLDTILLKEYEDLAEDLQEYYRYVAALEAVGTKVHRQLIIRMLKIHPSDVEPVLNGLRGIVDEYDVRARDGIYGWSTRHIIIARKITEYKFSSIDEITRLFEAIIDNINPAERIELHSIRDLCDREFGIGRLPDAKSRKMLYRKMINLTTGERIPWHRLIRELLDYEDTIDEAEHTIREAEAAVGRDAPIDRFKVRLLIARAEKTKGISDGDRLALTRKAYDVAVRNAERHSSDKFSYLTVCECAERLIHKGENTDILDFALAMAYRANERIIDPDFEKKLKEFEYRWARMKN